MDQVVNLPRMRSQLPGSDPPSRLTPTSTLPSVSTRSIQRPGKFASWDATSSSPNWHLEYSARQTYGASAPIAADAPLSAGWWHNVPKAFETNYVAFKQFYSFRGHGANRLPECTQANGCVSDIICDLRASMRSEICSSVLVPMKKRDDGDEDAAADVSFDVSAVTFSSW
ncbi:hypothetical protein BGX33_000078 [Mortierella sp. NVP41]|nr:hypothetical protein BGX33_000078 [Mortierella sp. NVP41]